MPSFPLYRDARGSKLFLVSLALMGLSACSDSPLLPSGITRPSSSLLQAPASAEQAALESLTRAVAMGLTNAGLRNQIRNDLRDSRHTTEHKLELRSYLKGESGGLLLAQMTRATGLSRDSLLALVNGVRPLEFYMPVVAHRESWSGGDNLLVAAQLAERNVPTGYNLAGDAVPLSLSEAPSTPTLSLVPIETDFTKPLDTKRFKNAHDKDGTTIGTMMIVDPCLDPTAPGCEGGTTPPPSVIPDAVYLTESHLLDAHEPWTKGSPEVEMHVHGPQSKDFPRFGEDLTCAGGDSPGAQYFDQNGNNWSARIGSGAPLLMSRYNVDQFQSRFPKEGVHYILWEDDYQACKTVTDRDMKQVLLAAAGSALGAGIVVQRATGSTPAGITVSIAAAAIAFTVDIIKNGASLIYGNDDLIGALIDIRGTPDEALHPGQTHLVKDGGTYNGTVRLEFVWPTPANGRAYAASVTPSVSSVAIDQAQVQSLTAVVRDQYGSPISGHPISWRSDNAGVVRLDDDGILRGAGAGNTTVYVRACDPTCMDQAIPVAVTGPVVSGTGYAYDETAYLSASVVNPRQSSYYYTWEFSECATTGCSGYWYTGTAGTDATSSSTWVSRYDHYVQVRLTVRTSAGGSIVGTAGYSISGASEYPPSSCSDPRQLVCSETPMSVGIGGELTPASIRNAAKSATSPTRTAIRLP
jgi:hypothetical protein